MTGFYATVVFGLLVPGFVAMLRLPLESGEGVDWWSAYTYDEGGIVLVVWGLIMVGGQALLLFLSVDSSWRRMKPRRHIAVSAGLTGFLTALLAVSAVLSLMAGYQGDAVFEMTWIGLSAPEWVLISWPALWLVWGIVFYRFCGGGSVTLERAVSWLLKGSVLELLIAVPAHVVARSREDCSAPGLTSWGIVTGIAIMLMCFGPGVLALYKKRLDAYRARNFNGTSS